MRKNKLLAFLLMIFFPILCNSQNIIWSQLKKSAPKPVMDNSSFLCKDNKGIFVYNTWDKSEIKIEHFDEKMIVDKSCIIDFNEKQKGREFLGIFNVKGKIFLLTSVVKGDFNMLYMQTVDLKTMQGNDDLNLISTINDSKEGCYKIAFSSDSNKICVIGYEPIKREDKTNYTFKMFDADFKLLWEKNQVIKRKITWIFADKRVLYRINDFKVRNNGDIFMLGELFNPNHEISIRTTYKITGVLNNGALVQEFDVEPKGIYFNNINIAINKRNDLICAGFYTKGNKNNLIKGIFYSRINATTNAIEPINLENFSNELLIQLLDKKELEKIESKKSKIENLQAENYVLKNITLTDDGGIILEAEKEFHDTPNKLPVFYYLNIVIIRLGADGKIQWSKIIPKQQSMMTTFTECLHMFGYLKAENNGRLTFIFNDNDWGKKTVTLALELQEDGDLKKTIFEGYEKSKVLIHPSKSKQIAPGKYFIEGRDLKANDLKYGILTF